MDTNPSTSFTGQLTDVSQVEKFELTEDEYAQRQGMLPCPQWSPYANSNSAFSDTVLAYKQRHKIGRFAEKTEEPQTPTSNVDIPLGSRCEVETSEEGFHKRGAVRFVGPTKFGKGGGVWVGVEYDEPIGRNDGRYWFPCALCIPLPLICWFAVQHRRRAILHVQAELWGLCSSRSSQDWRFPSRGNQF